MDNIIMGALFLLQAMGIFYIYSRSKTDEPNILLKLAGYSTLGAFSFGFNTIKLPLGFIVFILFFKPDTNFKRKREAAFLGFAVFLISLAIPLLQKTAYEWPAVVELESHHLNSISFEEEWKKVQEELGMGSYSVVKRFETTFDKDGELYSLDIKLIEPSPDGYVNYHLQLDEEKNLKIKRYRQEEGMMISEESEAIYFFSHLDALSSEMFNQSGIQYYTISSEGNRHGYAVREAQKFLVSANGLEKIENHQLPLEGIMLDVCGYEGKYSEKSQETCALNQHFLLDVSFPEQEVTEENIIDLARRDREINEWFENHTGESVGTEENGVYILKKDGKNVEVNQDEYVTAFKETPYVTINQTEHFWIAEVEQPYGYAPHRIEIKVNAETGKVIDYFFR
ncbi:hypothetical protein FZC79_17250 [Rossellomorea vietnamensis]|uniref:Uncharacterized protein n=1 Tax=Rossellomorea vietnamensis TaxID=218284 RepID=A0A5D4K917_9BACI|nr:hypothetical protein [Rossellomorea vietnamensis]TYR73864.1 hypothetical protein FZC79_17250 [Rossellomorea vietnamensis]